MNKIKEFQIINFDENPNNKLLCINFVHISKDEYYTNDIIQFKIKTRHFCFAKINETEKCTLYDVLTRELYRLDSHWNKKDYINKWSPKFEGLDLRPLRDVNLNIYWFEKIVQLDLFENNERFKEEIPESNQKN